MQIIEAAIIARLAREGVLVIACGGGGIPVERTASALGERGVRLLGDGKPQTNVAGGRIAFIHPGDFLGALVELEQHGAKERGA